MNYDTLDRLYVTGDYSLLLEEISKLAYDNPSTTLTDIERAICGSYHSRALIRLGEVNEAESIIDKISNLKNNESFSLSSLINQTSIINLQITQGDIAEALKNGMSTTALVEQRKHELKDHLKILSFWSAFLYFLIGMAHYHQLDIDLANTYFQKSLEANQTNLFIKAKCLYYLAFVEREKDNLAKSHELLEESLDIFQSIEARQGAAWIICWQGNFLLQNGNYSKAEATFVQAKELFESISDAQGLSLVNSLLGLMFYQQGKLAAAEEILDQAFESSKKIGNPAMLSYCLLPLVLLHLE
ncbi:MAG: tetratricopeptide repeat protein, partial [Candidatus Hodarchaeales archaeon]